MSQDDETRVLIVADDYLVRGGLAALVDDLPGCVVVGQASSVDYATAETDVFSADVAVWDLGWEPDTTLERLADTRDVGPPVVVLVADELQAADVWATGARGVLQRDTDPEKLVTTLAAVSAGLVVYSSQLGPQRAPWLGGERPADAASDLTPRELEVLVLIAEGLPNKGIADRLDISEHTVKFHVNSILGRLGAQSRTEAVTLATRMGLITL